jgi:hypothetical protein
MLTSKKNVFLLIPMILAFLPFARAEQLPRTPNLLPRCMIEAVVTVKRSDQPTTLTYKVTSCYWGNDALAVKVTRDDFAFLGYEVPQTKTLKYWIRGWDTDFFFDGPLAEDTGHIYHLARFYAHLGVLYTCLNYYRGKIEDDGSAHTGSDRRFIMTYSAWEHVSAEDGTEIFKRHRHLEFTKEFDSQMPESIPRVYDRFTTITLRSGHLREIAWGSKTFAQYEGYGAFGNIPARAFIQYSAKDIHYKDVTFSICSVVTSVHPYGPQDSLARILSRLASGLRPIHTPYSPTPTWYHVRIKVTNFFGFRIHHLVIGLAVAVLAWAAIRKFKLL